MDSRSNVIDVDQLLAPIPGDKPCGRDLRKDPSSEAPYYLLRNRFRVAKTAEREAVLACLSAEYEDLLELSEQTRPFWIDVSEMAQTLLRDASKDLDVAAYLLEALVRLHGFAGLRDGLEVAVGLVETWSDQLHPLSEDEKADLLGASLDGGEWREWSKSDFSAVVDHIWHIPLTQTGEAVVTLASYRR